MKIVTQIIVAAFLIVPTVGPTRTICRMPGPTAVRFTQDQRCRTTRTNRMAMTTVRAVTADTPIDTETVWATVTRARHGCCPVVRPWPRANTAVRTGTDCGRTTLTRRGVRATVSAVTSGIRTSTKTVWATATREQLNDFSAVRSGIRARQTAGSSKRRTAFGDELF